MADPRVIRETKFGFDDKKCRISQKEAHKQFLKQPTKNEEIETDSEIADVLAAKLM